MRVLTAAPPDRGGGVTLADEERGKSGEAGSHVVGGASDRARARTGNPSHNTQPHPSVSNVSTNPRSRRPALATGT